MNNKENQVPQADILLQSSKSEINDSQGPLPLASVYLTQKMSIKKDSFYKCFMGQNKTMVFIDVIREEASQHSNNTYKYTLRHMAPPEELLWEFVLAVQQDIPFHFDSISPQFLMMNCRQLIMVDLKTDALTVVYLQKQKIMTVRNCGIKNGRADHASLLKTIVFNKSQLFCISIYDHQVGQNQQGKTCSYYFDYKTLNPHSKPIAMFESQDLVIIQKLNQDSKVAWIQTKNKQQLQPYYFQACELEEGTYKVKRTKIKIQTECRAFQELQLGLRPICELPDNKYLLYPQYPQDVPLTMPEALRPLMLTQLPQRHSKPYVLEQTHYKDGPYFFEFPQSIVDNTLVYGDLLVLMVCQKSSLEYDPNSYHHSGGFPQVIVLNWKTEQVIAANYLRLRPDNRWVSFQAPAMQSDSFVRVERKENIEIIITKLCEIKGCVLQFMLHLYDDFDDDLLSDATELLSQ